MYVCICRGINEDFLRKAVQSGLDSMDKLERVLGIGTQCGSCRDITRQIVKEEEPSQTAVA